MAAEPAPGPARDGAARWRAFTPILLFALLIVVCGITLWKISSNKLDIHEIKSPLIGKAAPQFDLPSVDDPAVRVSNADLKGRAYIVNVWGTWCPECRNEHASLLQIARVGNVPVVGIDWKDDRELARRWLRELGNPYERVAADDDGRAVINWGVYGAPETFLVGPDGTILYKQVGAVSMSDWTEKFAPLIARSAASAVSAP